VHRVDLKSMMTSSRIVKSLIDAFGGTAEARKALLAKTNILPDALGGRNAQISAYDELIFLRNISDMKGADWVWRQSEIWKRINHGHLYQAIINATTCAEALNVLTRFGAALGPNFYFEQFEYNANNSLRRILTFELISQLTEQDHDNVTARDLMMQGL